MGLKMLKINNHTGPTKVRMGWKMLKINNRTGLRFVWGGNIEN